MILRLKLFVSYDDKTVLKDLYVNAETITGFFVPDKLPEDEDIEGDCVNIFYNGDMLTVLQDRKLVDFLTLNFVNEAI